MDRPSSPTIDRRALASALRSMRDAAGLSLEEAAAQALDASAAKLSRIETGKQVPAHRDVRDLCRLYGASQARTDALIELAHSARQRGWWEELGATLQLDDYVGLESAAVEIHDFQPLVIPALLQTEPYSEAFLTAGVGTLLRVHQWSELQRRQFQRILKTRQERILDPTSGIRVSFVLEEGAFLRIPDPAEARAQIERVRQVATLPDVDLRITPVRPGSIQPLYGGFTNLTLSDDTRYSYIETLGSGFLLDAPEETGHLEQLFRTLQSQAEDPSRTDELLAQLLARFR